MKFLECFKNWNLISRQFSYFSEVILHAIFTTTFILYLSYLFNLNSSPILLFSIVFFSFFISYLLKTLRLKDSTSFFSVLFITLFAILCTLFYYVLSLIMSGFYEIFPDGMTDHLRAVNALIMGWNPVLDVGFKEMTGIDYYGLQDDYLRLVGGRTPWISWYLIGEIVGNYMAGRVLVVLLLVSCFVRLSQIFPCWRENKFFWGLFLCGNPILIGFFLSHYVDHLVFLILIYFIFFYISLRIRYWEKKEIRFSDLFMLMIIVFFLGGLKASTIIFGLFALLSIVVYELIGDFSRQNLKLNYPLLLSCILGFGFAGLSPYFINLINYGDPSFFFNRYGGVGNSINVVWPSQSEWFNSHNVITRLFQSIFSYSSINPEKVPSFKIPGVISFDELKWLLSVNPDARIGGFGPLYSLAFCIGLALLLLKTILKQLTVFDYSAVVVFVASLLIPFGFWLRFIPFLWLLPLLICYREIVGDSFLAKAYMYIRKFCLLIIFINSLLYLFLFSAGFISIQSKIVRQIEGLRSNGAVEKIWFDNYASPRIDLKEKGIKFIEVDRCANGQPIFRNTIIVCND